MVYLHLRPPIRIHRILAYPSICRRHLTVKGSSSSLSNRKNTNSNEIDDRPSLGEEEEQDHVPSRTSEYNSKAEAYLIQEALAVANRAVQADGRGAAPDAKKGYRHACSLLNRVLARISDEVHKRDLQTAYDNYKKRISELKAHEPVEVPSHKKISYPTISRVTYPTISRLTLAPGANRPVAQLISPPTSSENEAVSQKVESPGSVMRWTAALDQPTVHLRMHRRTRAIRRRTTSLKGPREAASKRAVLQLRSGRTAVSYRLIARSMLRRRTSIKRPVFRLEWRASNSRSYTWLRVPRRIFLGAKRPQNQVAVDRTTDSEAPIGRFRFRKILHKALPLKDHIQEDQLRLPSVPDLRGAILSRNKFEARPWMYDSLLSRDDALKAVKSMSKFQGHLGSDDIMHIDSPVRFNEMASRLGKMGVKISENLIYAGLVAAHGHPESMRQYLQLWTETRSQKTIMRMYYLPQFTTIVMSILSKIWQTIVPQNLRLSDPRKAAQYLEVLTGLGFHEDGVRIGERRHPSLYPLLSRTSSNHRLWRLYLRLVFNVGGQEAVLAEWKRYQHKHKHHDGAALRRIPVGVVKPLSVKRRWDEAMRNLVIDSLAEEESSSTAWKILYEGPRNHYSWVETATWKKLLAFPEGLRKWDSTLKLPAKEMLLEEVERLERELGVEWVGAEDGYHVKKGEPFWQREDAAYAERLLKEQGDSGDELYAKAHAVPEVEVWDEDQDRDPP